MYASGWVAVLGGFSVLLTSPAAAKDDPPLVLAPSSPWAINYAEDSCRLGREFGSGDDKVFAYFERYAPDDAFFLLVAGRPIGLVGDRKVKLEFGPGGFTREGRMIGGEYGAYKPAIMASGVYLVPQVGEEAVADDGAPTGGEADVLVPVRPVTPEEEAAITWLDVEPRPGKVVRLNLGSMGPPMGALRKCTVDLLAGWGIDVAAHTGLTRRVTPLSNPGTWLSSSDYPAGLRMRGAQGLVNFRLSVDETGQPTQCHIQVSTRPEGFDKAVCAGIMKRARFSPAIDGSGKPIASYWRSSVRFEMPR